MADNRKIACEATLRPTQTLLAKLKSVPYRFAAAELSAFRSSWAAAQREHLWPCSQAEVMVWASVQFSAHVTSTITRNSF